MIDRKLIHVLVDTVDDDMVLGVVQHILQNGLDEYEATDEELDAIAQSRLDEVG